MASNIQRGTRKMDASDWIRLKRLNGARRYNSDQDTNNDVTNPPPTDCCVSTDNNRMDRADFGISRIRRPASNYTQFKAWGAADYIVETKTLEGKVLAGAKLCDCTPTNPIKHNPVCILCRYDKIEYRGTQVANFTVNAITVSLRFIAGVYGAGGNYDSLKAVIAALYSVSVADITNFTVTPGSIVITFTINYTGLVNFTIPPNITDALIAGLAQAIAQNANTNLSLANGDKSASFIITTPSGTINTTINDTSIQLAIVTPTTLTTIGTGFSMPRGVAVNPYGSGYVYVADTGNNAVKEITNTNITTTIGSGFSSPSGVALSAGSHFNIYVADTGNNAVKKITPSNITTTIGSGFSSPGGVAANALGDNIYVSDSGNNKIKKIIGGVTSNGTTLTVITDANTPAWNYASNVSQSGQVALDDAGNVYVADTGNNKIKKITPSGTITQIGSGFSMPRGVALDLAGNVYVADTGNNKIKKITPSGIITQLGSGFSSPSGVAVLGNNTVYVADTGNNVVKMLVF